jgi:hypothetical protein
MFFGHNMRNLLIALCCTLALSACSQTAEPKFTSLAVGTVVPNGEEARLAPLPVGMGGALLVNRSENPIRVVISDTLATIPSGQGFLFILPPATYDVQVFKTDTDGPLRREESVSEGKTRYVYILQ